MSIESEPQLNAQSSVFDLISFYIKKYSLCLRFEDSKYVALHLEVYWFMDDFRWCFCVLCIFSRWIIVFESSMPFSWICSIIMIPLIFVNLQCRAEFGMLRLCVWFHQLCSSVQIPIINHNGTIIMMNFSLWILSDFQM